MFFPLARHLVQAGLAGFVLIGGVAAVAIIGPKRLMGWVSRGALIYSTARRFMRLRQQRQ